MRKAGSIGDDWFKKQGWKTFSFQAETRQAYLDGFSGMVNAPTGSGKTYSLLIPILEESKLIGGKSKGPHAIWITPIRALSKEIELSARRAIEGMGIKWKVGVRTGDTSTKERLLPFQSL